MNFSIGHCRVTVSPLFTGTVTLMLLIDTTGVMSLLLGAMLIHEAGHLLFMTLFGCLPKQVLLLPFEVNIVAGKTPAFSWQQALISSGGILANLITAAVTTGLFQGVNWFLLLFNALPIFSMDGYQILELLCSFSPKLRQIPLVLSVLTVVAVGGLGVWLLWVAHNPMLLLFCLYMGVFAIRTKRDG